MRRLFIFLVSIFFQGSSVYAVEVITQATKKGILPLEKTSDFKQASAPLGKGRPEEVRQEAGNLVYSHYDDTGNTRNIVDFDFTTGQWSNLVQGKSSPRVLAYDSQYLIVHVPQSASFPIEVVDRKTGNSIKKLRLRDSVTAAFIANQRLTLFQGTTGAPDYLMKVTHLDLLTLKTIEQTTLKGDTVVSAQGDKVVTLSRTGGNGQLLFYDLQLHELGRVAISPPGEQLGHSCDLGTGAYQEDGDRAVLISNCGEIHVIDTKKFIVERTIPRYANYYSAALFKGLIFTTTEKQSGIIVHDLASGRELARVPVPAKKIFIKGDILLAIDSVRSGPTGESWPMAAYKINPDVIRSGRWTRLAVIAACKKADQLVQENDDLYQAVQLCSDSGIGGIIDSGDIPSEVLPYAIRYAGWLGRTLHRYDESLSTFEKLNALGITLNQSALEAKDEATLKTKLFNDTASLKGLTVSTDGEFARALKRGLNQSSVKSLTLPSLGAPLDFIGDYVFAQRWDCSDDTEKVGVGVDVYSRKTLDFVKTLHVRSCDDVHQDAVRALAIDKDKLYVLTEYIYPEAKRKNLYVFQTKSWKLLNSEVLPDNSDIASESGRISTLLLADEFHHVVETKSYRVNHIVPAPTDRTGYIFNDKDSANASAHPRPTFSMDGNQTATLLSAPHRDDVVFVGKHDNLGRVSLIHFDPVSSRSKTIDVMPKASAYARDDENLVVSNGVDVFIFRLKDLGLSTVMPRILGESQKEPREGRNKDQIAAIYIDNAKLIVRASYGQTRVFDLPKN